MSYRYASLLATSLVVILSITAVVLVPAPALSHSWEELDSLGLEKIGNKEYQAAYGYYDSLISLLPEVDVSDTTKARFYFRRGYALFYSGDMISAEPDFITASEIYKNTLGSSNPLYGASMATLGAIQHRLGKLIEAASSYEKALEAGRNAIEPDSLKLASSLYNLGQLYELLDSLSLASQYYFEAIKISTACLGDDAPMVLAKTAKLGEVLHMRGEHKRADSLISHCVRVAESSADFPVDMLADLQTSYGIQCFNQGNYSEAEKYYREAIKNWEDANQPFVWQARHNLALLLHEEGDYLSSKALLVDALRGTEANRGVTNQVVASMHNALGNLCLDMGLYDEAMVHYDSSISIWHSITDVKNSSLAVVLGNKANLLLLQDEPAEALEVVEESIAIQRASQRRDAGRLAGILETLAQIYMQLDSLGQAEATLREALTEVVEVYGEHHPLRAYLLVTLSEVYLRQNNIALSRSTIAEADTVYGENYGDSHPEFARLLLTRAQISLFTGDQNSAVEDAYLAFRKRFDNFQINAPILSEREALKFAALTRNAADVYTSIALENELNDTETERLLSVIFNCKNLVTRMALWRRQVLRDVHDQHGRDVLRDLRLAQSELSDLWLTEDTDKPEIDQHKRDSLTSEVARLEDQLSRITSSLAAPLFTDVNLKDVISKIEHNSAVLYYYKYVHRLPGEKLGQPRYLLAVMNWESSARILPLGDANKIEPVVYAYTQQAARLSGESHLPLRGDLSRYRELSDSLTELLMPGFRGASSDRERLYVSPDGAVNLISFAGLILDDEYLIERAVVAYFGQMNDLTSDPGSVKRSGGLLALGNPDFNATIAERTRAQEPTDLSYQFSPSDDQWSTRSGCGSLQALEVAPLPYTREEIDAITGLWQTSGRGQVTTLTNYRATEDALKLLAPSFTVLHIATHGFMLQGSCAPQIQGDDAHIVAENPLLLSGLLLAGANLHGAGADSAGIDDGILTALEISSLDLDSVSLVVLSACESGLGRVEQGEGVYGLRRAFQMAGADAVVSSLWSVPDKVTADLMSDFYQSQAGTASERLREAQLKQINRLREMGVPDHPYSWAAFIATGN